MTHTPEPSNPRHCPHSMVTDLCGLCIRDRQIKTLEQQNAALSEQVALLQRKSDRLASYHIDGAFYSDKAVADINGILLDRGLPQLIPSQYELVESAVTGAYAHAIAKAGCHE